jgi:hypothetical protein
VQMQACNTIQSMHNNGGLTSLVFNAALLHSTLALPLKWTKLPRYLLLRISWDDSDL